jgi:tRNA A-37 threonylcarbamoyl transferase component Bud32
MTSELILNGRYRLIEKIGRGAQGSVWKAEDQQLKRLVAVKELLHQHNADLADLEEDRRRAQHEAEVMAKFNHPSIVRIYDTFPVGKDPWIVMEYIDGKPLHKIIGNRSMDEREIANFALPVAHGLGAVHSAGLVHRDVKPANILVAEDGSVFLVDFGIAKIDGGIQFTGYRRMIGTLEYMAPERIEGRSAKAPSDLWSLGVTLFYALEGYSPFLRSGNHGAISWAIINSDPPAMKRHGPLADIVLQLLDKNPHTRASAARLSEVLQAIRDGRPVARQRSHEPTTNKVIRAAPSHDQVELAEPQLTQAREAIRRAGADTGVAMLLALSNENAAQVLAGLRAREAGAIIQAIAASKAQIAGEILQALSLTAAGHAVDYVSPPAAASIFVAMPAREAARILGRASPRTTAEIVMELAAASVQMLKAMPARRAVTVLSFVSPETVAAVFRASVDLKGQLLGQLRPAFQAQVRRYL